ncbi:MAG: LamG domain-containing protein, partial [Planctomycetes bacterium]|nr:LamG domain-containing protein [Planctomycetota bacterium]
EWNDWGGWDWYQTFLATGTSVRGVSWRMAGSGLYDGKTAIVRILEDNGQANVRDWEQVGYSTDGNLNADSDEWVRWKSDQVPLTPGKMYAVDIHIDDGMAIYKRDKDSESYAYGRAYDQDGNPQNFDFNITVFVDKNNQAVTHTRISSGPGSFDGNMNSTIVGQTFVAQGTSLAAVDLFAASGQADQRPTWTIHKDGPNGLQIGSTKTVYGSYFASNTDLLGVSYNPGEVPLTPGQTYYIEVTNTASFTPYTQESWNRYDDGQAFKNGTATGEDLAMTIIEYTHVVYDPVGFAGCWNFDETTGSTAADSSGNEHSGTLENMDNSDWIDGKVAGALEFDGINDYVQITDYKGITGSQARTCAAWIKTSAVGIIMNWGPAGPGDRWTLSVDTNGRLLLGVGGGAIVGTAVVNDDVWHHVAAVLTDDGSPNINEVKLYVDGLPDEPSSNTSDRAINTLAGPDVTVGQCFGGGFFNGTIDEVAIFDKELTEKQIKQLYTMSAASFLQPCGDIRLSDNFRTQGDIDLDCNVDLVDLCFLGNDWLANGVVPGDIVVDENVNTADLLAMAENYLVSVTPGLSVHLAFDETEGATAYDSSPNGHDAVVINSDNGAWVRGEVGNGNALAFDGIDDFVEITGFTGLLSGQSRTVCAWIKTTAPGVIINWGLAGPGDRWTLSVDTNGRLLLGVGGGAIVGTAVVNDDVWHHVAAILTDDGSPNINEVKLYVNGLPDEPSSNTSDRAIDTLAGSDVTVGQYLGAGFFEGTIDEVRIYDRPLSAEEIAALVS